MNGLPPPLAAALDHWHDRARTRALVAALESYGVRVAVRRLQLGDPRAAGFGQITEVYRTPAKEQDDGTGSEAKV